MMNQIVVFLTNHWILSSSFLIVLLALILNEWTQRSLGFASVLPGELVEWMNHHDVKVLDIRSQQAFQEGHILGTNNIPLSLLEQKLGTLGQYQNKPLIIVCAFGREAKNAAALLKEKGFKQVMLLEGGLDAWRAAGLPLQKKS